METSHATLNFSFLFVILPNLVLEAIAFQVFIKTFETTNCLIVLTHNFFYKNVHYFLFVIIHIFANLFLNIIKDAIQKH